MTKLVSFAIALGLVSTTAQAAEVVGVFKNRGACNSAWSHALNEDRKAGRDAQYYCEQSGDFWILIQF